MSLITRCPACTTMFKVVPDQLRVSDGWVRCGQCDEVFDANVHMQSGIQIAGSPALTRKDAWGVSLPEESPETALAGRREDVSDDVGGEKSCETSTREASDPKADPLPMVLEAQPTIDFGSAPVQEPQRSDGIEASVVVEDVEWRTSGVESVDLRAGAPDEYRGTDIPKLSFMRDASAPSVWNKPLVRAGLATLCVFLGGVLMLQALIQERDRIAAVAPGTKSFLMSVCTVWGCEISPLRQIDSVVIDSSSFVKVRADVYRLNFTLRNTSKIRVATPALELSLTDMKDLPAVRRVIDTPDFAPRQELMEPDSEFSASLPMSVKLPGGTDRISGYRLLAFYP